MLRRSPGTTVVTDSPYLQRPLLRVLLILGVATSLLSDITVDALANRHHPAAPSERAGNKNDKLLIIGLGRVGLQVADLLVQNENEEIAVNQVVGTVRKLSKECVDKNQEQIVRIPFDSTIVREHLFGSNDDEGKGKNYNDPVVAPASHVLFAIPLSREPDPAMEAVMEALNEWWECSDSSSHASSGQKVLGILSTTGVYGNHNGGLVTEESSLLCEKNSNAALYRTFENSWISTTDRVREADNEEDNTGSPRNRRLCIFRCAGIYDSSRSALHTVYKNLGAEGTDPSQMFASSASVPINTVGNKTNRIHSVDLARAVLSGMFLIEENELGNPARIFNLADNLPEVRSVVLSYALKLLSSIGIGVSTAGTKEAAPQIAVDPVAIPSRSSKTRQRRREKESKLVCNKRMREELLPNGGLLFPTYREGLDFIFKDPTTPWQHSKSSME